MGLRKMLNFAHGGIIDRCVYGADHVYEGGDVARILAIVAAVNRVYVVLES